MSLSRRPTFCGFTWTAAVGILLLAQAPATGQGDPTPPAVPGPLPAPNQTLGPAPGPDPTPSAAAGRDAVTSPGGAAMSSAASTQGAGPGLFSYESPGKNLTVVVGGRVQFDTADYITSRTVRSNIPGTNPLEDGVSFRRLRLDAGGTVYRNIEYYFQVDFANGLLLTPGTARASNATYPTDMWVTFKELPVIGNLRVGNQKPLLSFEHLTSSRFLNFMERSLGYDAFVEQFNNGFEPGVSAFDTYLDRRGTWAVGLFKNTRSPFGWNVGPNEASVNGRLTALPVYEDGGRLLVHVGIGAAHQDLDDGQARFRTRMDVRNSPSTLSPLLADTDLFSGTRQQIIVPEFVVVAGPFSLQTEYYGSWVHGAQTGPPDRPVPQGTVYFQSWYVEAHYFLTGEVREYDREKAIFGRVSPRTPVDWTRGGFTGWGAWQVAARYSYLDLDSKGIVGGRVHDMTLGLNWFLNPNMKVQWNYSLALRDAAGTAGDGLIHSFGTRLAFDF